MQALIAQFASGGEQLRRAVQGLSEEDCQARPGPGDWSIHELVIHLQDSDAVGIERMKRVISHDNPSLLGYDETLFVKHLAYQAQSLADAVTLFDLGRQQFARVLRQLPQAAFTRVGEHNESGPQSLSTLLTTYVEHLDHHLKFLRGKRERLGKPLGNGG
jgi:uncharacterized damage-inducible protein DinB